MARTAVHPPDRKHGTKANVQPTRFRSRSVARHRPRRTGAGAHHVQRSCRGTGKIHLRRDYRAGAGRCDGTRPVCGWMPRRCRATPGNRSRLAGHAPIQKSLLGTLGDDRFHRAISPKWSFRGLGRIVRRRHQPTARRPHAVRPPLASNRTRCRHLAAPRPRPEPDYGGPGDDRFPFGRHREPPGHQ